MTRLDSDRNLWLATVRPDGRPHLTPVWYVWHAGRIWCCVSTDSVKARNVRANPAVSFSLENGNDPMVGEGRAIVHSRPYPVALAVAFSVRYEWDITQPDDDGDFGALIEIEVDRWLMGDPEL